MSRFRWILALFLIASTSWGQEPRLDSDGDPLPLGAVRRFGTVRFRQEFVRDMVFTPDGKALIAGGENSVVKWDVATGKPLRTIPVPPAGGSYSLSHNGRFVVVGPNESDGASVVHDLETGKEQFRKQVGTSSFMGGVSPDDSQVAILSAGETTFWDLRTGEKRAGLRVSAAAFSPDGKWLVGRFREGYVDCIRLYDAKTGEEHCSIVPVRPKELKEDGIVAYRFTPDGRSLIVSWQQSGILIYDIHDKKVSRHLDPQAFLVAISPDSKVFASSFDQTVLLTSIATGKEVRRWQTGEGLEYWGQGAFSPDGKILALPFECGVQLWDPETGKRLDPYRGPIRIARSVTVSNDAKSIAAVIGWVNNEFIHVVDTDTAREIARLDSKRFGHECPAFSPDGRLLAFTDCQPTLERDTRSLVRIMDVATRTEITPKEKITAGFVSRWKDNRTIYLTDVGKEGQIRWIVVDFASGKTVERLPFFKDALQDLWPPARRTVMTNRDSARRGFGQTFLADWPSGKRIRALVFDRANDEDPGTRAAQCLSPDDRLVLSRDDSDFDRIIISEAATGRERHVLTADTNETLRAFFSPDGRRIFLSCGASHKVLDALTFETLMDAVPLKYEGTCVAFSANGKIMVTGDRSSLLIWDLKTALRPRQTSPDKLTDDRFRALWSDLESDDARVGHRALVALIRRPGDAVAHIASRFPGPPPDDATFARLFRELADGDFKVCDAAYDAIAGMGDAAGARIREALKVPPSPAMKRRLTMLADKLKFTEGDRIRWARCAELLERIGSPEARAALERLRYVSDPETADDAARSLERLAISSR